MPERARQQQELDALAHRAADRARDALAMLLQEELSVAAARLSEPGRVEDAAREAGFGADDDVCRLEVSGPPDGCVWVAVPERTSRRLAAAMQVDLDESLVESIRAEIANIVVGTVLTELGDAFGTLLEPSVATIEHADTALDALRSRLVPAAAVTPLVIGCDISDSSAGQNVSMLLVLDGHDQKSRSTQAKE